MRVVHVDLGGGLQTAARGCGGLRTLLSRVPVRARVRVRVRVFVRPMTRRVLKATTHMGGHTCKRACNAARAAATCDTSAPSKAMVSAPSYCKEHRCTALHFARLVRACAPEGGSRWPQIVPGRLARRQGRARTSTSLTCILCLAGGLRRCDNLEACSVPCNAHRISRYPRSVGFVTIFCK
jgi:hypothetical protein